MMQMVFFIGVDGNWKFKCILKREEQGKTHTHTVFILVLRPEPWRFGGDFAPIDALEAADVEADDVELICWYGCWYEF